MRRGEWGLVAAGLALTAGLVIVALGAGDSDTARALADRPTRAWEECRTYNQWLSGLQASDPPLYRRYQEENARRLAVEEAVHPQAPRWEQVHAEAWATVTGGK